ncbi:hypothetical protein [Nostoc sp. ChiQUE01b]|uniref:hypothetical protein n=1 Tax=Nostoc sp. ChiQUE01b TaxID=3075376 RepID=UPI002AD2C954|nr:hypothetical protein [Nostoc sp. ChiQUE01b]MDZ8264145.1 hypothetical protein [Nostoc sp. ChiQUE01b]
MLFILFPEQDKACKNPTRRFLGSREYTVFFPAYDKYLNVNNLLVATRSLVNTRLNTTSNLSRNLDRLDKSLKVDELAQNPLYYLKGIAVFNPKNATFIESKRVSINDNSPVSSRTASYEILRGVDFEQLANRVKIFQDFCNPNIKLNHVQLLGIASSLRFIEGGEKFFIETVSNNPLYANEKKFLVKECRKYEYHAASLYNFSEYSEDWEYSNIYEAARINRTYFYRRTQETLMTLATAEEKLHSTLIEILQSNDTDVHVIKKATGLGGTTLLAQLLGELSIKAVVAFPNHALKQEKIDLFSNNSKCEVTPILPKNIPQKLKDELEYCYKIGSYTAAKDLISKKAKRYPALHNYWINKLNSYKSSNTVLTTHTQAMYVNFDKHTTYIFDEDPLRQILEKGSVTLADLKELLTVVKNKNDRSVLSSFCESIINNVPHCIEKTKALGLSNMSNIEAEVIQNDTGRLSTGVLRFLDSDQYAKHLPDSEDDTDVKSIEFIKHNSLNSGILGNKKIIIMSATASEFIYKALYGDRVKFYDIDNVDAIGLIDQNRKYSYSQRSLQEHTDYITEQIKDLPTITFKKFRHKIKNALEDIYYWKCEGFDELKGKDIAVVGTPHLRLTDYLLYGAALGIDIRTSDFKLTNRVVEHNGIVCLFNTFQSESLQKIQFHFIEEQIEQAIGRARHLREDVVVKLFTNFPVKNTLLTDEERKPHLERLARIGIEDDSTPREVIIIRDDEEILI